MPRDRVLPVEWKWWCSALDFLWGKSVLELLAQLAVIFGRHAEIWESGAWVKVAVSSQARTARYLLLVDTGTETEVTWELLSTKVGMSKPCQMSSSCTSPSYRKLSLGMLGKRASSREKFPTLYMGYALLT